MLYAPRWFCPEGRQRRGGDDQDEGHHSICLVAYGFIVCDQFPVFNESVRRRPGTSDAGRVDD